MVSVVLGSGAGLTNTSRELVGTAGEWGQASIGRAGERVSVNGATGNLVIQNRDEFLVGVGDDISLLRTYNSAGVWDGDNADSWRIGYYRRVAGLTGTVNTTGSTIKRVDADGFESTYTFTSTGTKYVGKDGAGSYDSLTFNATTRLWTWTDGDSGSTETYAEATANSNSFRLTQVTDVEGHSVRIGYDANSLITTIASWKAAATSADETLALTYDNATNKRLTQAVTTYKSDVGATLTRTRTRYEYDVAGRLEYVRTDLSPEDNSIADGRSYWVRYGYNAGGRVSSITQTDGTALSITYDASNRVSGWTDALGRATTVAYDTVNRRATITDMLGQATVMKYDTTNRLVEISGAAIGGGTLKQVFAYNTGGDVTSTTNAQGQQTVFAYSANGALTRSTDAAGNVLQRTYDSANRLTAETLHTIPDPDGAAGAATASGAQTTRYVYDTAGGKRRLHFTMSPEGRVTQYQYNTLGQRSSATTYTKNLYTAGTNPTLSQLTTWASGLSATDRATAERRDYGYDLRGQLTRVTEYATASVSGSTVTYGTPSVQRYVYDAFGRLLQSIDATNRSTVMVYDGLDRLALTTDASTVATTYLYDDAGNKTTVRLANGLSTVSTYNRAGLLVATDTVNGAQALGETRYFYDAVDRLRMTQDPTGARQWFVYDPAGRKVADISALGRVTEYAYDAGGRLVQSIEYANVLSATVLATLVDGTGNPIHRTVGEVRPAADAANDRIVTRYYDGAGRMIGTQDALGYVTETLYDGASRLVGTLAYATATTVVRVDTSTSSTLATPPAFTRPAADAANDRVTRNLFSNDGLLLASLDAEGFLTEWEYDAAGRRQAQTVYFNATPVAERAGGTLATLRPAKHLQDRRSLTLYDNQGRVAAELDAEGYLTEFGYDLADRLQTSTRHRNTARLTVTVDAGNVVQHLAAAGLTPASLRPATGGSETTTRTYTALGKLDTETSAAGVVTKYNYDGIGRLESTVRAFGSTEARTNGITFDAFGRVQTETGGPSGTVTHAYDAAGRRISTTDARNTTTVFFYDSANRLVYSIRKTPQGGEVVENRFNTFGETETRVAYSNRLSAADTTLLTGGLVDAALASKVAALSNAAVDAKSIASFSRRGQIQQAIDALGKRTDYDYSAFGQLRSSTADVGGAGDSRRLTTELVYDRRGLLTTSTADRLGLNIVNRSEYDAFGRTTATVDARGNRTTTQYLKNDGTLDSGRKVVVTDTGAPAGVRSTSYDAFDRVVVSTDALGNSVRYVHDVANRRVTMTTAEGIQSVTEVNRHGQTWRLTDGTGATTSYAYDANGRLLTVTDANGNVSQNAYDANGNLQTAVIGLKSNGASAATNDGSAVTTQYSYDAANRVLTRSTDPAGLNLTTRYEYDGQGRAVKMTDATGAVTTYAFNAKGELTRSVVDDVAGGLRLATAFTYDAQGRTLTVIEGQGTSAAKTTEYRYDVLGRRTHEITDPAGLALTTTYSYDEAGNLVLKRDALNNATRYVYDALNRQQFVVDTLGGVSERLYDSESQLIGSRVYIKRLGEANPTALTDAQIRAAVAALSDARDQLTQYVYDRDGRRVITVDALGGVTKSEYNNAGRVTTRTRYAVLQPGAWTAARVPVTDARDQKTYTVYDAAGRTRFSIDALNFVTEAVYDRSGRVVASKRYANAIARPALLTDANVTSALSTTADTVNDRTDYFVYDAAGRQRFSIDAEGYATEQQLDAVGRVIGTLRHASKLSFTTAPTLAQIATATRTAATFDTDVAGFTGIAGVWEAGRLKLVSQPDAGGTWASMTGPRSLAPGSSIKFDLTPTQLQQTLHAGAEGTAGPQGRMMVQLLPNGRVLAQTIDAQGVARYTDIGAYTAGTTYTVEITTSDNGATLYFYAKGAARETGAIFRSDIEFRWTALATRFYAWRTPSLTSVTTAFVDNVEERNATVTSNRYDAAGRLTHAVDAEGVVTFYAYDAQGRVTDKTRAYGTPDASTTHYAYDAANRVSEETMAYGTADASTTRYSHDAMGRMVTKVDARGVALAESNSTWAAAERQALGYAAAAASLNAAQKQALLDRFTTRYGYDTLGQRTSVTDALGGVSTTEYDRFGNAVKVTDARGNSGYFAFDQANRNTQVVDPEGFVVTNSYDAFGNKTGTTQYANRAAGTWSVASMPAVVASAPGAGPYLLVDTARDATISLAYDRLNRIVQRTEAEDAYGTGARAYETYGYDAFGNKTSFRNKAGGSYAYQYDRRGLVTRETAPVTTKTPTGTTIAISNRYVYDARGNRVQSVEAEGANEQRISTYRYDALDRLTATTNEALTTYRVGVGYQTGVVPTSTRAYDARGNVVAQTDANGNRTTWYYDALSRKVGEVSATGTLSTWQYDSVGNAVVQRVYGDAVALPAGSSLPAPVNASNVRQTQFTYDASNREIESRRTGLVLGRYDEVSGQYRVGGAYGLDKAVVAKTYDAAGNLIKLVDGNGGTTYSFYNRAGQKTLEVDAEGFGVAWTYGINGTAVRETRFAQRTGAAISEASDASALIASWPSDPADRIAEFGYDRNFRLVSETRLNVAYGSVDSTTGALSELTGAVTKSFAYDGLDHKVLEIDANGRQSDWTYDAAGRLTKEQLPSFVDFEGATVRATTDYEYNGLNAVVRVVRRGKDNAVETDDEITRYTYGTGGRLLAQTDAKDQVTQFDYDAAGNLTVKRFDRKDADGVVVTEGSVHAYDAMNREISRQSASQLNTANWQFGDKAETRYNAYGDITGKRTNGGNASGEWQEFAEYNALGKVSKTNSGNGITKAYLYDANGNATLSIESAGADLRPLTLDQILARSDIFQTITLYDKRNQTSSVIQPNMTATRDVADVRQFTAQQVTLSPGGGGQISNVGALLSTQATGSTQAPTLTDAQRFQPINTSVNWATTSYTDSEGGYVSTGTAINSVRVDLSVPSIGQYVGAWTSMKVRIEYTLTGATATSGAREVIVTDRNASSATVNLGLTTGLGNINFTYRTIVSFNYAATPAVTVGSAQFGGALAWESTTQVSDGEGGYTSVVQQNFAAAAAFNGAFKTTDLGVVASVAPTAFYSAYQDAVGGDLVSSTVSWAPDASSAESGYDRVKVNGVTVGLPVSSFVQTFGNFVRAVAYVDYDLTGDAYGTRTVSATITNPAATSVYVPINYTVAAGNVSFSYTVRVAYYWSTGGKEIQLASTSVQNAAIAYITTQQVPDGEGGYTTVSTQNFAASNAFNRSFYADTSNKTFFSGGSELVGANEVYLYYRTSTSAPYQSLIVPRAGAALSDTATAPTNSAGGIFYVWNSWLPAGIVDYKLVTMSNGALTASFRGNSIGATTGLQSESRSQLGQIFFDSYPAIHFFDQATSRLDIEYRRTGTTGGWSRVEVARYKTNWFSFGWQQAGLSGQYDMRILRRDTAGAVTSRMFTQVNLSATPTATTPVPYTEGDLELNGQPANTSWLNFRYRPAGSTGAFTSTYLSYRGPGRFGRDFQYDNLLPTVTASSAYNYEYQYDAYDAGGQVVNSATGNFIAKPGGWEWGSHNSTRLPTLVPFTVDDASALYMDVRYRAAGSTGAYATVPRLSRSGNTAQFKWDASAITPATGSASYEYEYRLYDSAGNAVLNPLGQAIVVNGTATVGDTASQAATTGWVITGTVSSNNIIQRRQTHNAFGEVDSETDGRGYVTNHTYNTLGALVLRQDPTTDVTGENGVTTRARPETRYYYDRAGRAIANRDANGNLAAQLWNDGLARAQVAKEFHADNGKPVSGYDIFGNLRTSQDAEGRVSRFTYDKNNQLTRLDRPTRATGQYLQGQGSFDAYEYDILGQRISMTSVLGRMRTYYDLEGRVSKATSIEGRSTTYAYNYVNTLAGAGGVQVGGWQKLTTMIGGKVSSESKDVFGRMSTRTDFGNHRYDYTYNNAGWLTNQRSTDMTSGAAQQNLTYEYYANGYLKRQTDLPGYVQTDYTYDANGNRVFEGSKRTGGGSNAVLADSEVTYDELNRVKTVHGQRYDIRYKYDAVGNRRNVYSYYNDGLDGNKQTQDYWYRYDSMNRFTVTQGQLAGGQIVRGAVGKAITYSKASERMTAEYAQLDANGNVTGQVRERYTYTSDGYLQDMVLGTWNGSSFVEQSQASASRSTDLAGRVTGYIERKPDNSILTNLARSFDRDNRQTQEIDYTQAHNSQYKTDTYTYNADGTLAAIATSNVPTTTTRSFAYQWWDSAKQTEIKVQAYNDSAPGWAPGSAITAGVGAAARGVQALSALNGNAAWQAAGRAAIGSGVNQALHGDWSWRQVMVSAASAGVGSAVGGALQNTALGNVFSGMGTSFAAGLAGGLTARALTRGDRSSYESVFASALGNAWGSSIAESMQSGPDESVAETARLRRQAAGGGGNGEPPRDWFAGASLRLGRGGGGLRLGGAVADEPFVDSDNWDLQGQSRAIGVSGREAARGAWGIARSLAGDGASNAEVNRVKNQLLALNPELVDGVKSGQRYYVPDASTPENLQLARNADWQYQAALAVRAQAASMAWGGGGLSFDGNGTSFAALSFGGGTIEAGPLSGWQRTQAHAMGVYDAGVGAIEGAGYSFGVVGTPESRAAWAVQTAQAGVEGIRRFINDPRGTVSGWWDNLTGDDPAAIRQATAQGAGLAIGVAGGVATGRLQGGLRVGTASELDMFRRVANQGAFADLPVLMDLKTVRSYASEAGIGLDGVKVRIVRDESLIGRGIGGYTHPNGKSIDLYPDAFSSPEELVRTIAHERMHVYQTRTFGEPAGQIDLRLNENAAYGLEDSFVHYWRLNKGR
jgi:YD repeat-containing protein